MYLPTFWKLTTEATFYRLRHVAGYGVPVGFLCKLLTISISYDMKMLECLMIYSCLDFVPISLQLDLLMHYSTTKR